MPVGVLIADNRSHRGEMIQNASHCEVKFKRLGHMWLKFYYTYTYYRFSAMERLTGYWSYRFFIYRCAGIPYSGFISRICPSSRKYYSRILHARAAPPSAREGVNPRPRTTVTKGEPPRLTVTLGETSLVERFEWFRSTELPRNTQMPAIRFSREINPLYDITN